MRTFIGLLALIGSATLAGVGYHFQQELTKGMPPVEGAVQMVKGKVDLPRESIQIRKALGDPRAIAQEKDLVRADAVVRSSKFVAGAIVMGLLGAVLILFGRGMLASVLMAPLPLIAGATYFLWLIVSVPLLVASILAAFVHPRRKPVLEESATPKEKPKVEEPTPVVQAEPKSKVAKVKRNKAHAGSQLTRIVLTLETVTRFQCEHCTSTLRTSNPVPVGKKIHCPNCGDVTRIHVMKPTPPVAKPQRNSKARVA